MTNSQPKDPLFTPPERGFVSSVRAHLELSCDVTECLVLRTSGVRTPTHAGILFWRIVQSSHLGEVTAWNFKLSAFSKSRIALNLVVYAWHYEDFLDCG